MGVIESHHHPPSIFPQQSRQINELDFNIIPNYSYTHQVDPNYSSNFVVLSHKQKPQFQIEKYELFFNTYEEYKAYEEVYEWRNRSKYLVQARAIRERANNNMCGNFHEATLFVQRIPIRACEIMDVPIQEGLYLLYTCFMGFRKIYERTGYFDISLDMICINKEALVKIWLNNNLSKIYPEFFSLDQNFTESDFIFKLLTVCQPLIDFSPIEEKFSDFLKGCCFSYQQSPKKDVENKFCKYSKFKQSTVNMNKKQLQSNLHLLSFDKIIEYFEGYLNKHKLVIAREMKTVKDLFKIQPKIQYKDPMSPRKQTVEKKQSKEIELEKLQILPLKDQFSRKKPDTKRTNTKRTHKKLATDRSNTFQHDALFSYKSEEHVKNLGQLKEPQFFVNRQPSVSFGEFRPIHGTRNNMNTTRNFYPTVYSPQHLPQSKPFYMQARDRIKTVFSPNISFCIKPRNAQMEYSLSPNHSYKSTENMFFKKKGHQSNLDEEMQRIKDDALRRQSFPGKCENQQKTIEANLIKEKKQKEGEAKNQSKKQSLKRLDEQRKRKVYYDVQKQFSLDDEIALDLDKFQAFQGA